MTECERLICEGFLPAKFLEPEMREIMVPVELKKLWAIQIEMIRQVEMICQRHGLRFFANGGTCIGAVRHHGFIPWDDDVDLALMRDDYNQFIRFAAEELPEPYFLQTPVTDPYFYSPHIWLRNSNTTGIAHGDGSCKCNNGIAIHIFPLDGFFEDEEYEKYIKIGRKKNITAHNSYHYKNLKGKWLQRRLLKLASPVILGGSRKEFFIRREQECTEKSQKPTALCGLHTTIVHPRYKKLVWEKEDYSGVMWMPFEYYRIPVPVGYDAILTKTYGEYMKFPPEEKRVWKHSWEMDPDMPYKEYCSNKYGVKY